LKLQNHFDGAGFSFYITLAVTKNYFPSTITRKLKMTWHTYEVPPIDFGWENLNSVQEIASRLLEKSLGSKLKNDIDDSDLQSFLRSWNSAKEAASEKGWDGDLSLEPVVMWIPNHTEFNYGFALKQDNNGTTYVISPVRMPWLESDY
jgi:hypothetical protein